MSTFLRARIDRSAKLYCRARSCGLSLALISGCGGEAPTEGPPPRLTVQTIELETRDGHAERLELTGVVRSDRSSRLGFERAGRVVRIAVEEGARVAKGSPLARLDERALRAGQRKLKAALRRAEAKRGLSQLTADRIERLAKSDFAPDQQADEARFGSDAAGASVEELEASLEAVRLDLEKSTLRSPFSGVVTEVLVDEGTVVAPGAGVVRLLGDRAREVWVGVPARELPSIRVGQVHPVEIDGQSYEARVRGILDAVDPRTRTVGVVLGLPEGAEVIDGRLARLVLERWVPGTGYWVPTRALRPGPRGTWTLLGVEAERGEVLSFAVSVGYVASERVFVEGRRPLEHRVISEGLQRVVPGQLVLLSRGSPEAQP